MITSQSSAANLVDETGFGFSHVKHASLGYVFPEDILYPLSLSLRTHGNIDLSVLTNDDVFVSAALAGNFEAKWLEGLLSNRLGSDAVRWELQPDAVPTDLFFALVHAATTSVSVSRKAGDVTTGVNLADALAALRIAVGFNPNSDSDGSSGPFTPLRISPCQIIAVDVSKDGRVTSADALAILKIAVRFSSAVPQEWNLINEKISFWNGSAFALTRINANWESQKSITANLPINATTNMVGVLFGDVNFSWVAPVENLDLNMVLPDYFKNFSIELMGVPLDLWGDRTIV